MAKYCVNCGAKIAKGINFCTKCGTKNIEEKPVPQPSYTPPQQPTPPIPPTYPKSKSKSLMYVGVIAVVAILIIAVFYFGYMMGSEQSDSSGPQGTENYGVIMGRVTDTGESAMGDVTVTANGQPVETNNQGWFSISNVAEGDRVLVDFNRDGYTTTQRVVDVESGESNFIEATLGAIDKTDSFYGSSGGTITTSDGGSITVGSYALEDSSGSTYTDTAQVQMTVFDPTNENDANAFPGEYLGISSSGEQVPLKSYGFMDITVKDSYGNDLQLSNGQSATLKIPVPSSLQSESASMGTCPLWYYDTDTGYWREEGQGTYSSGSFIGTITHFSTWNFDVSYPRAYISGRVVDGNGIPIQGATVKCWGPGWTYSRWASGETSTASDGTFTRIPVETNVFFNYKASKGGHESSVYTIPRVLVADEEYDVGDIYLDAPSAQITLTWGEDPRDLDSHLAASLSSGDFHVYYVDMGDLTDEPYASLDTDDTTSYGPEVISVGNLRAGTYRYSVRHYAGDGDIETSGAEVNVIIQGVGIYRFTPPTGQPEDTDIWRIIDIVVGSSGTITAVNTINDYVSGGDESTLLYP
jgi:hypothetical protein